MKKLIIACMALLCSMVAGAVEIEPGVSQKLAEQRRAAVGNLCYDLKFRIPASRKEKVTGSAVIKFTYKKCGDDLQLDFQGADGQYGGVVTVNGKKRRAEWRSEHIILKESWLKNGENAVDVAFTSGDKSLNRNDDYLYTLFVPDHARSVFPCFDQPDLKAVFKLKLDVPEGWETVSSVTDQLIPTYLFSFVAGKFSVKKAERSGRTIKALYRETDPDKVAQLDKVFDIADHSIRWFERYTGIPLPFSQYNMVVLPGFQFGGMEHPGAIQFTDHEIFLGKHPTPEEEQTRLELIAHETAHMWFGDMVTMRWFNDVWTKEVFANFFAAKVAREQYPDVNHDLNFLRMYQARALSTDRTPGTHPIQQSLDNLNQAGLLYGNIIYCKAPVMMRKLEQQMGEEALRDGIRQYLHQYAYGNATWDELIDILDSKAPQCGIRQFSETWVKCGGMPTVSAEWKDGRLIVKQEDPQHRGLVWQQQFNVRLDFADGNGGVRSEFVPVDMQSGTVEIETGGKPQNVLLNADGRGYGLFVLNDRSGKPLMAADAADTTALEAPADELQRFALAMTLNENFLAHRIGARQYANTMRQWIVKEHNAMIASQLAGYWNNAIDRMDSEDRSINERMMWAEYRRNAIPSVRQRLVRLLYASCQGGEIADSLYAVWKGSTDKLLNKNDYNGMAYRLAIMMPQKCDEILAEQRKRLSNVDELRQFDFVSRACTPDTDKQQTLFQSVLKAENRQPEPWTASLLALLNDRTREPFNNRYITPGLDALIDVQRTSDIFFPGYWLGSLLRGHRSSEAAEMVKDFVRQHPGYPQKLMNKLNENAFWLLNR